MEKTYKFVENAESLPLDEIKERYTGHWIYLVNVKFSETNGIISGKPVVIGNAPYDGVEDGIYKPFRAEEYEPRAGMSLLPNKGFISALRPCAGASK
jgi:hypothetical protein